MNKTHASPITRSRTFRPPTFKGSGLVSCLFGIAIGLVVQGVAQVPQVEWRMDGDQVVAKGLEFQGMNTESRNSLVERDGKKALRETKMAYFKVTDGSMKGGKTPLVFVELDYYDEGRGLVVMKYDSSDSNVMTGNQYGTFKPQRAVLLTGSGEWKTARFQVPDAWFATRCNGGDFRFESPGGLTLARLTLTAGDEKAQEANRKALAALPPRLKDQPFTLSMDEVWAKAEVYRGPAKKGTDPGTLTGKIMCGYQGWHGVPGDGTGLGWVHWGEHGSFGPGDCHVECWPDLSEASAEEKIPTAFRKADGSVAHVYTSMNPKIVDRHFRWMEEAGIDGVFLQRFASGIANPGRTFKNNTVLSHVRAGANAHGRTWAVMYDLSGHKNADALVEDWKRLVKGFGVGKDPAYQKHRGKPVLAIWGLFGNRPECFESFEKLMDLAMNDPVYGGFCIKLGTDNSWRTGTGPNYERVRAIVAKAQIVSPWSVGRYGNPENADIFIDRVQAPDVAWCKANGKDYMPVLFPGFSWYNMHDGTTPFDAIPRLEGRFFWSQAVANRKAGADMFYVAMFDEIDEGTAIYKVDPNPPVQPGEVTKFLTYGSLPSDHYLWLAGKARGLLDGTVEPSVLPPVRPGVAITYTARYTNGLPEGARELSAVLHDRGTFRGLAVEPKGAEVLTAPTNRLSRNGWLVKAMAGSDKVRKLYVKVEHVAFKGRGTAPMVLEVDLFSEKDADVKVVYDSRDFTWQPQSTAPGAWKEAGFLKAPAGAWTTARLDIRDPLLVGRCNGADFRFEIDGGAEVVIGAIRLKR